VVTLTLNQALVVILRLEAQDRTQAAAVSPAMAGKKDNL